MTESTTIIAFDQHARAIVAAVLVPRETEPALHPLASDLPTIGRFVSRLVKQGPVRCCDEAGPCGLAHTCAAYLRAIDEVSTRLTAIEDDLRTYFTSDPFAEPVRRLRCFRGISDLTALTVAAELGDPRRFPSAPRVMGFVGWGPSEHSSGTRRGRGAMTKTGNAHLRRVLLEAAWHYRHHPHVGPKLHARQRDAPAAAIAHAWAAQHRLYRTYRRLTARGRPPHVAATAVARELAGFIWATLTH